MKIGILGTGAVGSTIGTKLVQLGNEVKMGSRAAANEKAMEWTKKNGSKASQGTFADAASFGEIVFNCTNGSGSMNAIELAGRENLKEKILIDIANPLDFTRGMPPSLTVCNTDSLAEQIQRALPETKVVKTLNTVNAVVMVNPKSVPGEHDVFLSGNDSAAKAQVEKILKEWFGWKSVIDLGDIKTARGVEMILPLWVTLRMKYQIPNFNFHITK